MIVEFTHRITSGIALILVIAMVIWAYRLFPKGDLVRRAALWSGFFIVTEALLGAMLVLLGHTALNPALTRGFSLSIHLVNTLFLLATVTLTAWWAGTEEIGPLHPATRPALVTAALALLAAGIVGAIAALGDTLFAPTSIASGLYQDFAANAHPFVRIRVFHPILAVAAGLYLLVLTFRTTVTPHVPELTRKLAISLMSLVVLQFAAGMLNILMLVPITMQLLHLLLADLLWMTFVLYAAETLRPSVNLSSS
jgi:heme A synthase